MSFYSKRTKTSKRFSNFFITRFALLSLASCFFLRQTTVLEKLFESWEDGSKEGGEGASAFEFSSIDRLPSIKISKDRQKMNWALSRVKVFFGRSLSNNLGEGKCEWTAAQAIPSSASVQSTFLASFPGSGKRLSWMLLEALTGNVFGDSWDHSGNGYNVVGMKSNYPHHESPSWLWNDKMDHTVLQIRNPRWALPDYISIRDELRHAQTWEEAHDRIGNIATENGPIAHFETWKSNKGLQLEIKIWSWLIDFWMENGLRRYLNHTEMLIDNQNIYDYHCNQGLLKCKPEAIVSYERLSKNETGPSEIGKIANVMMGKQGINVIDPETWACIWKETVERSRYDPSFKSNMYRYEHGPEKSEKKFSSDELIIILNELEYVRDKYSTGIWADDPIAVDLYIHMNTYIADVSQELAQVLTEEASASST